MDFAYHTIILGLGAMGTAVAAHLAKRLPPHEKVLGLEQFDIGHNRGSSHGRSRLIRLAYYEHADYVPLLRRAYELWRELERDTGESILHVTGGIYFGPPGNEVVEGSLRSARQHGLAHEIMTGAGLAKRWPQFRVPTDWPVFYEPEAGFLVPEKALAAHATVARNHGADLHPFEGATHWKAVGDLVEVQTPRAIYRAKNLVITAGAWTGRLLPFLAGKIRVTRQVMLWLQPHDERQFMMDKFPIWCAASQRGGLVYGPPMIEQDITGKKRGLKISHHFPGIQTDPDTVNRDPLPGDEDAVRELLQRHLPEANGTTLKHCVCLYSNSPDHHFLIDHHPQHPNILFAAGFSGHGFKFSPVIGESLADLVLTRQTTHPITFLSLKRLQPPQ